MTLRPFVAFVRPALVSALLLVSHAAIAQDWNPVDPAELAQKDAKVQPGADAEALLWEVRVRDEADGYGEVSTTFHHYLRVKIFTDRGRETFATVDLPHLSTVDIKDVAARTIKADGSIVELKKSDVYRRTVVKTSGLKVKAVSFAVPAIERGAIVEYRWKEVHRDSLAMNMRLEFSRGIPVQTVRYLVGALDIPGYQMVARPFGAQFPPLARDKTGFSVITLSDVPADGSEDYAVPAYEQRPWVFVTYQEIGRKRDDAAFARDFGKLLHTEYSKRAKPNDAIRTLATQAIAGMTSDADKLAALVRVAREKVRRIDVDTASAQDLRKAKETKNASDALSRGVGGEDDVLLLVLALANAAGLDVRVAASPNRGDLFPRSVQPDPYFYRGRIVALRSGNGWLFADPGNEYASAGRLRWEYEDQRVLIADAKGSEIGETPLSPPAYSLKKRTATFKLLEDGTLEGEARLEFTGHWADVFREQEDQDTAADREKDVRDLVARRLPGAELSDVRVEHVTDSGGPYANVYRIRIPGYAQRTGSRLLLQPSFFQRGIPQTFAPTTRKSDIYFPFPWSEEDVVTIELPDGYTLEASTMPKPADVGAASFQTALAVEGGKLVFRRNIVVAKEGIYFSADVYKPWRGYFDALHRVDAHALVLRRKDAGQ